MKKNNILIEILKFMGVALVSWLLFLFVFAIFGTSEGEELSDFQNKMAFLSGLVFALVIEFGLKYNGVRQRMENLKAAYSNIDVTRVKNEQLLDKANRVAEKYMFHEENIQISVAESRSEKALKGGKRLKSASQFRHTVENYPELKANEAVNQLLAQIEQSENTLMRSKVIYNDAVQGYNMLINSFPTVIIKKICKWKEMEYYKEREKEITDEMLGI